MKLKYERRHVVLPQGYRRPGLNITTATLSFQKSA